MKRAAILFICIILMLSAFSASYAAETSTEPAVTQVPHFDINGYRIEGDTLLGMDRIHSLLAPYTGKNRDFGTVQEALEALERNYHDMGYTSVQVVLPEQELEKGIVLLKVVEAHIGKVNITGNNFFGESNIRRSVPELNEGQIPNINYISNSLKVANENPAKKINLQLQSAEADEEIDANIVVQDEKPWKAGLTFDNTGDARTGRFRAGFLLQYANLFNRDHILSLQYMTSTSQPDHVGIYGMGYHIPFYRLGSSLDIIAAYSDVNSGTLAVATNNLQVSGKGTIMGLHYNQNLTRIGNYEHKLVLALDYRAYINNVMFGDIQLGNNVTVHPISLTYSGTYTMGALGTGFYAGVVRNLPALGSGERDTSEFFEKVRSGAPEGYNILKLGANISYSFSNDWQARMMLNSQLTNKPLVPGEQFGAGGAASVRGFDERQLADDEGYSGSLEIYSPNLSGLAGLKGPAQCRALVFSDFGHVSRIDPLPGEHSASTISSVGPGIRVTDGKYFTLSTDYGFVTDPGDTGKKRWSGRWHFAASLMY